MCSDHFAPWTDAPGRVRVRLVVARRRAGVHLAAVRRRHRARAALSPRDHGAGDRDARRDVPRPVLGGARQRRGDERAHHRRRLAGEGRSGRPAARVRRRDPRPARRRGGHAHRHSSPSTGRACGPCHRIRPRLLAAAVSAGTAGRVAEWADGLITVAQAPDALRSRRRRVPLGGRSRSDRAPGAPELRRLGRRSAAHRVGAMARRSGRPAARVGPRQPRRVRSGERRRDRGRHPRGGHRVGPTRASWPRGSPRSSTLGFDSVYLHHVGTEQDAFIDMAGAELVGTLRGDA